MLECRTYTYDELSKLFQTPDNQGIKRKLDRMDVHTPQQAGDKA